MDQTKPIAIILSPHLDDAVLAMGGFLAKGQYETEVDTFFAGKPSKDLHTKWDHISGFKDSDQEIEARVRENEKALGECGAIIRNFNYLDFQYRGKIPDQSVHVGIKESIENDIRDLVSRYPARQILMYGPATFGPKITHTDHEVLHNAFMTAVGENNRENIRFFIYEDLPYTHEFIKSRKSKLKDYIENKYTIKLEQQEIEISKAQLEKKIRCIQDYPSQIEAFEALGINIPLLARSFNLNRCKTTHPSWYACEVVYKIQL